MSEFCFPSKRKKIVKALKKLGLSIENGAKHDFAKCIHNGKKTTIPRHKEIKREIVESIASFLLDKDFERQKLLDLLK
ncbi:MAG: type II toxin-antitoxin system HicA family toxin [Candidatus Portnoybacteria bacterium]|nr:type II toxin-antitoxin system HicA family toxin [Candidatus Portnoybacteria bacterium]